MEQVPEWVWWLLGAGGGGIFLRSLWMVIRTSDWSIGTMRDDGRYQRGVIVELRERIKNLEVVTSKLDRQRRLTYDWRAFAASFHSEVLLLRHVAMAHNCAEIVTLIDQLEAARQDNPLMADIAHLGVDSEDPE